MAGRSRRIRYLRATTSHGMFPSVPLAEKALTPLSLLPLQLSITDERSPHSPLRCLPAFLKGQIFPLRSHSLGSCSSRPSPVSRLAFPQHTIISPSSPRALTGGCTNVLRHLSQGANCVAHHLTKALAPLC